MLRHDLPPVFLIVALAACGAPSASPDEQITCATQGDCPAGTVCALSLCRDEAGDPDWDGVPTGREVAAGTSPLNFDTDGDGHGDGDEWGTEPTPMDTDGDGVPDVLESGLADADGDCVPDPIDPDDDAMNPADQVFARGVLCRATGRCEELWEELTLACVDGVAVCAYPDGSPVPNHEEDCDLRDEDCDGETDEGLAWGEYPVGQGCVADGICGPGVVECNLETLAATCSTAPGGSESPAVNEFCNGEDDDCDGIIDDGFLYQGHHMGESCVAPGICGAGVVECAYNGLSAFCSTGPYGTEDKSQPEQCDALDNDCDGDTDEELTGPAELACPDTGVCGANWESLYAECAAGNWACASSDEESPFEAGGEVSCDALDNDCDGETDEGFEIEDFDGAAKGIGEECGTGGCAGGKVICASDRTDAICSTWVVIEDESCDGKDNDCDGETDEGLTYDGKGLGDPCNGVGYCGNGVVECDPETGAVICSTDAGGSSSEAAPEACDLVDNDCDGETDEDPSPPLDVCPSKGVCQGALATIALCEEGGWVCQFEGIPGYQASEGICDDLDNDCDGKVDEFLDKTFSAEWEPVLPGVPPPRRGVAAALSGEEEAAVIFGGAGTGSLPPAGEVPCRGDLWILGADGEWTEVGDVGAAPRAGAALGHAWAAGGHLLVGGRCGIGPAEAAWMIFDPVSAGAGAPVDLPPGTANRTNHAILVEPATGAVWLIGGRTSSKDPAPDLRLDPDLSAAAPLEGFDSPARAAAVRTLEGAMALVLGSLDPEQPFHLVWEVDLDAQTATVSMTDGPSPLPRDGFGLAAVSTGVLLYGGRTPDDAIHGDLWVYEIDHHEWTFLGDGGPLRTDPILASTGDGILLTGGFDASGAPVEDAWATPYTGGAPDWTPADGPRPPARVGAAAAVDVLHGEICLAGGVTSAPDGPVWTEDAWCRAGPHGVWAPASSEGGPPAAFSTLSHDPVQDRYLLIGGAASDADGAPIPFAPLCGFHAFHRAAGEWEDLGGCGPDDPLAPLQRAGHAAALRLSDATLWVFGGLTPGGMADDLWRLDLQTGEWAEIPLDTPPAARYGHHLFMREDGDLIVAGGQGGQGSIELIRTNLGTVTSLGTLPWTAAPWLPAAFDAQSDRLLVADGSQAAVLTLDGDDQALVSFLDAPPPVCTGGADAALTIWDAKARSGLLLGGLDPEGHPTARECVIPTECLD